MIIDFCIPATRVGRPAGIHEPGWHRVTHNDPVFFVIDEEKPTRIAIRDGKTTHWVDQDAIDLVEAAGDYMCIHSDGQTHILRATMKSLEELLDAEFLQRVHRSTIVNLRRVTATQPHINGESFLELESGHKIKVSRTYREALKHLESR